MKSLKEWLKFNIAQDFFFFFHVFFQMYSFSISLKCNIFEIDKYGRKIIIGIFIFIYI